ncbi:MAG: hypothetical protein ACK4HE_02015 [Chitinophagaceae bacterium]
MNTNINRKNYEEWLLLYVDNELSAAERTAVDAFVAQNPDVAAELALLQDTQLTNLQEPTLSFGDISHLLKSETAAISAEESTLLSYLDNELDAEATKAFEQALQQQPTLAATFALYQQTKLTPEHIACPNKEALLQNEKERRIVYFRWWQYAAAALVIGVLATTGVQLMQHKGNLTVNDDNIAQNPTPTSNNTSSNTVISTKPNLNNITNNSTITFAATTSNRKANKALISNAVNTNSQPTVTSSIGSNNSTIQPADIVATTIVANAIAPYRIDVPSNNTATIIPENAIVATTEKKSDNNSNIIHQASYNIVDTEADDNSVYIGAFELNKTKVKGLIRKAGRLFNKKAKAADAEETNNTNTSNNGKLQIAGFEVQRTK